MANVKLFYGSTTGNTQSVAEMIKTEMGEVVSAVTDIARAGTTDLADADALAARRKTIRQINARGIIATPANSSINELVTEAARLSIVAAGQPAVIEYGDAPGARLR